MKPVQTVFQIILKLVVNYISDVNSPYIAETDQDLISSALVRVQKTENDGYGFLICEPLPLEAAVNYFSNLSDDYLLQYFDAQLFSPLNLPFSLNARSRGFIFEFILAVRVRVGWWRFIPDDSPVWDLFPQWSKDALRKLDCPKRIVSQQKKNGNSDDWCLLNFEKDSDVFVLPDFNCGPDGLYAFMSYNAKTCWTPPSFEISNRTSKENLKKADMNNWCRDKKRRDAIIEKATSLYRGLLHFQIEFPRNESPRTSSIEGDMAIIYVDIDSEIAKYMFGEKFIDRWKRFLEDNN